MPDPINILVLVEDDDNDVIITKRKIAKSSLVIKELILTRTIEETKKILTTKPIDIVLLDLNLPDSTGLNTLDTVRTIYQGIVIILTSIDDELIGIEAIKKGADEYLVKSYLNEQLLSQSIYKAIERKKRWARVERVNETIQKLDAILVK